MSVAVRSGERSISELFGELATETCTLVRQEVHLAAVELTQKAAYAGRQAALVGAGVFVGLLALQALLAAAVVGLAKVLPLWAAALAVGGVLLFVAGIVATKGISSLDQMNFKPSQTLRSVEDNKSWMKKTFQ